MIVISGALVLIALVLLIVGLVAQSGLTLIYASIAVSVVSAVFLYLGVRQRRGELPAADGALAAGARGGAVDEYVRVSPVADETQVAEATEAAPMRAAPAAGAEPGPAVATVVPGQVLVVPGRPRYHVAGCRFLAGREYQTRAVADARDEGFTPCSVCRPDDAMAAAAPAAAAVRARPTKPAPPEEVPAAPTRPRRTSAVAKPAEPAPTPTPARPARIRAPRPAPADAAPAAAPPPAAPEPTAEPAPLVSAATDPVAADPLVAPEPTAPRSRGATGRLRGGAAAGADLTGGPAPLSGTATVVAVAQRRRFHRAECRYAATEGAQEMTKSAARKAGYDACGVCKP